MKPRLLTERLLLSIAPSVLPMLIALGLCAGNQAAEPIRQPADWDTPYSADNPPGPSFSEAEKQRQLADGLRVREEIIAACQAGKDAFTVPPGDYRFGANWMVTEDSFVLKGLHRTAEKPFRILAHGATFWFNLSDAPAPSAHRMVKIIDCSHVTLEGLIIDSDPRGCMDARITAFDFEGNRIQVEPLKGTRLMAGPPKAEGRFIPFKANGHHLAALYAIDAGWGPGNVFYKSLERTADGRVWLTMKNDKLLHTVRDETWRKTYGSAGTLEVGDVLGVLYSTSVSIWLSECQQITVRDCHVYAAKSCLSEDGGYGDHQWINCRFMARPGTNNVLGGEGTMDNACQHGSTFDGVVIHRSSDDGFNNHGYWQHAASAEGQTITFKNKLPQPLAAGDPAEVYDDKQKSFVGRFTIESVNNKAVTFREPLGDHAADATVIFPGHQNAGWVIRNCTFVDCYQRVLLQCGPGMFENNRVVRVGSSLAVSNGPVGHIEGGSPDEVTIRGNVFLDSSISPTQSTIGVGGNGRALKNLRIENNLICNSGREAIKLKGVDGLVLRDNIVIHPFLGSALLPETKTPMPSPIRAEDVHHAALSGNLVLTPAARAEAEAFLRQAMDAHGASATDMIADFKRKVLKPQAASEITVQGL